MPITLRTAAETGRIALVMLFSEPGANARSQYGEMGTDCMSSLLGSEISPRGTVGLITVNRSLWGSRR